VICKECVGPTMTRKGQEAQTKEVVIQLIPIMGRFLPFARSPEGILPGLIIMSERNVRRLN